MYAFLEKLRLVSTSFLEGNSAMYMYMPYMPSKKQENTGTAKD